MRRSRRRHQPGFTIMELIIASLLAMLVIAGLYVVYAAQTRVFRGQEMVSQAQFGVRYAMEVVQADLKRAGYMAIADTNDTELSQRLCGDPTVGRIKAVELTHDDGAVYDDGPPPENVTGDVARPPQTAPDELILVGNFLNEDVYWLDTWTASTFTIQNNRDIDPTDPFPPDEETFNQIFSTDDDTLVRIKRQGKLFFSRLTGRSYDALGDSTITLADSPACAEFGDSSAEGAEINVVHRIRYRVAAPVLTTSETTASADMPGIAHRFDLYREYLDWTDEDNAPPIREVIAENVVDFQVWFLFDQGEAPDTGPLVNQVYDFNLNENNSGGPPCNAGDIGSAATCGIKSIFGAVIRISVRAPHEDPTFLVPPGDRYPLNWYILDPRGSGNQPAARVRTLISQVELPNLGFGI